MLAAVGDPHRAVPVLHVAGTNGKGSTCATLDALLRAGGHRVGRYTSPHLVDFRERILVDGAAVAEDAVLGWLDAHQALIERTGATFFEATTVMAFDLLARARVDVAVIEVGLGGRLDATNVVEPLVAGITGIGFDHMEFLGGSLAQIAAEKAGICKPGRPVVIGEPDPSVAAVLRAHAEARGATPVTVVRETWQLGQVTTDADGTVFEAGRRGEGVRSWRTPLIGEHQARNALTALAMLEAAGPPWTLAPDRAAAALAGVRLAGRFQRVGPWLFDVAHNADGAATVVDTLRRGAMGPGPLGAVVCVLRDKDWPRMLAALLPHVAHVWLTEAPTAPPGRRWDLGEASRVAAGLGTGAVIHSEPSLDAALAAARAACGTVLVTGSFHTVGDAMAALGIDPLSA
ncbi:MAG: bifunctional folylpolyglutamate synthase/dihydrofolate synthase [Gemmatimonadaceae bacterium]|nr:bifunctional folylpolyglutamate synthase/dihydrofolate synthase [Gemmatimonadaceae bacterium]